MRAWVKKGRVEVCLQKYIVRLPPPSPGVPPLQNSVDVSSGLAGCLGASAAGFGAPGAGAVALYPSHLPIL